MRHVESVILKNSPSQIYFYHCCSLWPSYTCYIYSHHLLPSLHYPISEIVLTSFWHYIEVLATRCCNLPDWFLSLYHYYRICSFHLMWICNYLILLNWLNYPLIHSLIQIIEHFTGTRNTVLEKRIIVLPHKEPLL